jgi:hypothetical protein
MSFMLIHVTDILSWLAEALPVDQELTRLRREAYSLRFVAHKNIFCGTACIQETAKINVQTTPDILPLSVHCNWQQYNEGGGQSK